MATSLSACSQLRHVTHTNGRHHQVTRRSRNPEHIASELREAEWRVKGSIREERNLDFVDDRPNN